MTVEVSGTDPWIKHGPLALRITVKGLRVSPDLVVPGDGPVRLPPLPSNPVDVTLVDGTGHAIEAIPLDLDADRTLSFAAPRNVTVSAVDETNRPLAGVRVLRRVHAEAPRLGPIPGRGGALADWRAVATTGEDGTVVERLASNDETVWFLGRAPGLSTNTLSGWLRGRRIQDGDEVHDEGPLQLVLRPAETTSLRVRGLADGERAHALFRGTFYFRSKNRRGGTNLVFRATAKGGAAFTTGGPAPANGVAARLHAVTEDPVS